MDPRPQEDRTLGRNTGQEHRPPDQNTGQRQAKGPPSHKNESVHSSLARTDISEILLRQRAKAEAARVRFQYAGKEAELLLSQADQEAALLRLKTESTVNLKLLDSQRELEETEALLRVFSEGYEEKSERLSHSSELQTEVFKRTDQYVSDQTQRIIVNKDLPKPVLSMPKEQLTTTLDYFENNDNQFQEETPRAFKFSQTPHPLRPEAAEFMPQVQDFTKYIMKKELLMSRLTKYDDKPERYIVWKTSFKNIILELEVTPAEEMDLLIRWLGPKSKDQAESLRAANIQDIKSGLLKIWQRLDERYGSPELVQNSLQRRLNNFEKIGKDHEKLYELSDLCAEIDSVKNNVRYHSTMAYLDSSCGMNPIISKLPGFMQTKWINTAIKYKFEQKVVYPPFSIFAEFIRRMSMRLNDPSFNLEQSQHAQSSHKLPAVNYKPQVSARKTQVQDSSESCPLHSEVAKHSLKNCRKFISMKISERKDTVLKYGICFKCLESKHLARDCQKNIKCDVCGSVSHCSLFHIYQKDQTDHGGERTKLKNDKDNINNICTQICGDPR